MKTPTEAQLKKRIHTWLWSFIILLLLSGITAFPLGYELGLLYRCTRGHEGALAAWIARVYHAVAATGAVYPFMAYGTDWLAFAHLVIAVVFIGPLRDPVRNIWVLQSGMIACAMVLPLAFICGAIRHIPFFWQLIDCSFGVLGFVPLYACYCTILKLASVQSVQPVQYS